MNTMTTWKLNNLLGKMGTKEGWHIFLDGDYRGFTTESMAEAVERIAGESIGFVDYMGNNLFFTVR